MSENISQFRVLDDANGRSLLTPDIQYYEPDMPRGGDPAALDQYCNLYVSMPENASGAPVLVWFHGGGLTSGDKEIPLYIDREKVIVVAVSYRLYGKGARCPDFLNDAAAALTWTLRHIGEYGGDMSRIYVSGHSAGSYLLTMLALDPRWLGQFGASADQVAAWFSLSGQMTTHFAILDERRASNPDVPIVLIDEYAPLHYAKPNKNIKIFFVTGDPELDFPARVEENQLMVARLRHIYQQDCAPVTIYPGCDHGTMLEPALKALNEYITR